MIWKCIVCEQDMEILFDGNDEKACWPNIDGGTIQIGFGYGSVNDNISLDQNTEWQTCICDTCFAAKKHLCRNINVIPGHSRWELVKEKRCGSIA